ncbi:DUF3488 and DUF4129 domain-containing transglutaminase family protein [Methylotuvimicrobium sp. KM1]|uniref:transglutaminase TgpA family protein n=1 Tax=Methylotuvimicrobium sp. KM1 TaxID=3377707 RepID=UPI0038502B25
MLASIEKNILLFLLISVGLIALPHIYHIPASIFGFFVLLLTWRFIGIWKPSCLPGKLLLFLLTVGGLVLLYSQHQGLFGRDAGTRLFMTALALKLLEIRQERDLYLIVFLAFIVAASQFLYEQSIAMAGYILFVCCVLLGTLVAINSRRQNTLNALKTSAVILAQALPLAIVLFVFFPRVEAPRWMLFEDKSRAKTGLSDSMEPGSISDLGFSDELVFRVRFQGPIPPNAQRYWRGPVFSVTDGKRWTAAKRYTYTAAAEPDFSEPAYRYTLLLEPQNNNWVFALEMAGDYPSQLHMNSEYLLTRSGNPDKRAEYPFTSYPSYRTGELSGHKLRTNTQLPGPASQKITSLIKRLGGFDKQPEQFVDRVLQHFNRENFSYTLTPPLMEDNPIETFLFETRSGFCSHYAAAFTYLMRVANIPARVVTGYHGGVLNPVGNFLEIRQADAHAWTEVWLENRGWVRVDPTAAVAPERIEQNVNIEQQIASRNISFFSADSELARQLDWLKQARQLWSSVDYNWQRWVINYHSANQTQFLASLGIESLKQMLFWLVGLGALFTAILSWLLLSRKERTADKVLRCYRRFCTRLGKAGLKRNAGEGPIDFAKRSKKAYPEQAEAIDEITGLFIKLRYQKESSQADLSRLSERVDQLKIRRR